MLNVRVLQAADGGVDAEPRSVVDVAFNAVSVGDLVDHGIFPPKTLGAGEVEAPTEHRLMPAVR